MYRRVDVNSIKIGERFRKDSGDLQPLVDSIKDIGLLNPITIDQNLNLIAGYRRLSAFKNLGYEKIDVHIEN